MAELRDVTVEWHDEQEPFRVTVSIDEVWNELEEDDENIFFYFANEQEFEEAKQPDNQYEFRILEDD